MMLSDPGWTVSTFRNYYVPDQLAYLAIATDWSVGRTGSVEPFAETGSIYYPRLYYQFLGVVARVVGVDAPTAWTVVGLVVQALLVGMIGLVAVLLTRRAWAGLFAFLPFLVGTLANVRAGGDTWYVQEGFHARLWGVFASIFTLNGDNAAMALGITSLLVLMLVAAGRIRGRAAVTASLAACFVIGGLSAIQTYSFLTNSYLLAATAAGWGLYHCREARRWWLVGTGALVVSLFVAGPHLVGLTGPLVLLVLAMTPALPGIWLLWRQLGRVVVVAVLLYGVGAAPQVLITLSGVLGGDAFLSFRQGNVHDLGVPLWSGLISASPVLLPLIWVLAAGVRRREPLWVVMPAGGIVAWFIAASNDVWGANQEPYRMWLNCFTLMVTLGLPLALWVAVASRAPRKVLVAAVISVVALFGAAFPDFLHWRSDVSRTGYVAFDTPQLTAAVQAAAPALDAGGLLLAGPCFDPLTLKPAWTGPLAYFNRGLAWPDHEKEIRVLDAGMKVGLWAPKLADTAQVRWLLVDTSCTLAVQPAPALVGATLVNQSGPVQLWELAS